MNEKTIKTLGIATVVTAIAAVSFTAFRNRGSAASPTGGRLIPTLEDRINDVRSVVIEGQDGTVTLNGSAAGWTLAEMGGYAVDADKARDLLLALRDARRIEEKTADPQRLGRLGLDAPDAEDSTSKRVTLKDAEGETITTLLIGSFRASKAGATQLPGGARSDTQYYVLPEVGGPAFLAAGNLRVDARTISWLDQQFLDVGRDRIRSIRITHPDDEVLTAARREMDDLEMEVLDVPKGKVAKSPSGTATFLSALGRLRFDDVKPVGDIEWATNPVTMTEFYTEHGLTILVESIELPKEGAPDQKVVWARFRCEVAPDQAPQVAAVEEIATSPFDDESKESEATDEAAEGDPPPTMAELEEEARSLTESTAGWAYALPSWKTNAFRARLDTFIEDAPEPEPEEETIEAEIIEDLTDVIDDDSTPSEVETTEETTQEPVVEPPTGDPPPVVPPSTKGAPPGTESAPPDTKGVPPVSKGAGGGQ